MWILVSGTRSLSHSLSLLANLAVFCSQGDAHGPQRLLNGCPVDVKGREGKQASSRELPSSQLSPAQLRFRTVSYSANTGGFGAEGELWLASSQGMDARNQPHLATAALPVIFEQVVTEAWPHRAREDKTDTAHVAFPSPT